MEARPANQVDRNKPKEREAIARTLLDLAQFHKENCNDESCCVSLELVGRAYIRLVGRALSDEEMKVFI